MLFVVMKRYILMFSSLAFGVYCLAASITTPANLPSYYSALQGKSGAGLFSELTAITNKNFHTLGYDGLYSAYSKTDYTPSGELWDMYSDCGTTKKCGSYKGECDCYNREHSIPQSWWGGGTSNIGCDIFHVVPTDGYVNNRRGNDPYGEVSSASYTSKNGSKLGSSVSSITVTKKIICSAANSSVSTSGGTVFEPIDEYKGDFARGILGTIMKWNASRTMTSSEGSKFFQPSYTASSNYGLKPYGVALLLKWHRQDPVSQKEIDRNNGIQATQGNRNPFIDYPYLVEYIWGEHAGEAVDMDNLVCSASSEFVPGKSDGQANGTTDHHQGDNFIKIMWMANYDEYTAGAPSISVLKGTRPTTLPTPPASCSGTNTVFCGWTATPIDGITDIAPADLFVKAEEAPEITEFTVFYAVFAEQISTSTGSGEPQTLVWNHSEQSEGWTDSGLMSTSNYSVLQKGAVITSPSISLSGLESITINMRTYGGKQYNTITVSANGNDVASLVAKDKELADVTWNNPTSLAGQAPLVFTSSTSEVKAGPGINTITVKTKGVSYSYGAYRTSCSATTPLETLTNQRPTISCYKYIRGGQLIINIQGVEYNTQGQQLK